MFIRCFIDEGSEEDGADRIARERVVIRACRIVGNSAVAQESALG